jgi:molybdate transport repressor ModE-like protein
VKHVTLRQLRILAAVVGEGSFSGAAKALHLTQPAVSMQVRELEQSCGLALVERGARGVRLTEAGREIVRATQGVERELKSAEDTISALKGLKGGLLTVAVISTAQYFAPRLLTEFCRRHADVKLRLDVCNRDAIVGYLERDEIDIGIMGRPPAEIVTAADPFARNPHIAIAAPGHPLARRRRIPVGDLLHEPFIAREPGSGTREMAELLFSKRGLAFAPTLVMNSNETIKQAVIAGMGVSFLSLHTVALEVATGTLAVLDVAGTPVMRRWYLVHRQDKRLSPVALAFRGFMLAEGSAFVENVMAHAASKGRRKARLARLLK